MSTATSFLSGQESGLSNAGTGGSEPWGGRYGEELRTRPARAPVPPRLLSSAVYGGGQGRGHKGTSILGLEPDVFRTLGWPHVRWRG